MKMINIIGYFLLCLPFAMTTKQSKPNILLILMDDLGYSDVGYYGGDIPTPNIDQLANNGIRLNYHYSEDVCSATRSSLLTGRYSWKTGLDDVIGLPSKQGTDLSLDLISDVLSDKLKYDTLLVGKWHIGSSSKNQLPHKRGFKHSLYFTQGQIDYFQHNYEVSWPMAINDGVQAGEINATQIIPILDDKLPQGFVGYDLWKNKHKSLFTQNRYKNEYTEDIFLDRISEYLRRKQNQKKNEPFFIYWSMPTPHTPIITPPETSEQCQYLIGETRQTQCNMLYYADLLIGRVIDDLKAKTLYENTLIIFLSDNGAQPALPIPVIGASAGQPLPFKGSKINAFEGGIRTPAIIGGGYLETLYGQVTCDYNNMVYVADFYPIIAGLLDVDVADDIDGINLWSNIEHECGFNEDYDGNNMNSNLKRDEIVSFRMGQDPNPMFYRAYVRTNEYKLLINPNHFGNSAIQFDFLENWVNYDGNFSLEPNETYYRQYNEFDINHYDQKLFVSECYDNFLDDPLKNPINIEPYISSSGDKIYLYNILQDNIEACNIAINHTDVVNELMNKLVQETISYKGSGGIRGDKGSYLAMKDSYNCDQETFFYVTSDKPKYSDNNINQDWNEVILSILDKVDSC